MFSNLELAQCAEREVRYRKWVYPARVESKRITEAKADKEIAMMKAIAEHFLTKAEAERKAGDLLERAP